MASSPPVPRMAAPRISFDCASTTIFMKPCDSPFSTARPTLVIGRFPTMRGPAGFAAVPAGQAGAPQRRVDVQSVSRYAVTHAARVVIEQVRRHNFEIVIGGVCKPAFAVAVRSEERRVG